MIVAERRGLLSSDNSLFDILLVCYSKVFFRIPKHRGCIAKQMNSFIFYW